MKRIWSYQDYVDHLTHPNNFVRRWAFNAIGKQFPRRYTKEISALIGDSDEHLACMAPRYLAKHNAVEFAPAILESFKNGKNNVPSNCALALGDMQYEQALDVILERLHNVKSLNTFLGILNYLGKIKNDECHQVLITLFKECADSHLIDMVAYHLLEHRNSEDVPMVFDMFFKELDLDSVNDTFLKRLMGSIQAERIYDDLTEYGSENILKSPRKAIDEINKQNPILFLEADFTNKIVKMIEGHRYQDIATFILFNAQNIVRYRFPEGKFQECHSEIFAYDTLALRFLKEFRKI